MKKQTVLGLIVIVLVVIFSFKSNSNKKILTLAISSSQRVMIVINETGNTEEVKLKFSKMDGFLYNENLVTINNKLNELSNNGYKLLSSTGDYSTDQHFLIYTFEKE